jgi:hypothetical protein
VVSPPTVFSKSASVKFLTEFNSDNFHSFMI